MQVKTVPVQDTGYKFDFSEIDKKDIPKVSICPICNNKVELYSREYVGFSRLARRYTAIRCPNCEIEMTMLPKGTDYSITENQKIELINKWNSLGKK